MQYDFPSDPDNDFRDETYIEEVIFIDGCFEVENMPLNVVNDCGEIIGNIYENPELLK